MLVSMLLIVVEEEQYIAKQRVLWWLNVSLTCASSSAFWLAYHLPHSASRYDHDSSANWRGCCYNLTQQRHCLHLVQSTTCRYRLALLPPLRLLLQMALVLLLLLLLPLLILFLLLFMFCFCWLLDAGCWMLAAALPSSDSHTNSQDHKIACAIMEIFPFEFRRRMSLEANGTKRTWNGRLPEDVIFTRICIESCAKRTKEEFQLTKNMHIHTTYYYTYLLVSKLWSWELQCIL